MNDRNAWRIRSCRTLSQPPVRSLLDCRAGAPLLAHWLDSTAIRCKKWPPGRCAITGGAFYDPATARLPSRYLGKYFYADYCKVWIRTLDPASGTSSAIVSDLLAPVDLEVGGNGVLYYISYGSSSVPASGHKIE